MAAITAKFQVGDVVRLKSGGPKMTVALNRTRPNMQNPIEGVFTGIIKCSWFEQGVLKEAEFNQDMLEVDSKSANP